MNLPSYLTRRSFIATSTQAAAAFSLAQSALARGKAASFKLDATQARAVAVDADGLIAVAADRRLVFHRLDGQFVRAFETARPVRALCFDARGSLFATFSDQVARVHAESVETIGESFGRDSALTGLAVADTGDIFVADSGQRAIWRLDARGARLGRIRAEREFAVPRAFFPIAWGDGHLLVAEPGRHEVQRYTAEGKLVGRWGGRSRDAAGFAGCCNPVSFAALPDGSVVTAERGQPRVKSFDAAGHLLHELAGPDTFPSAAHTHEDGDLSGCEGGLLDVASAPGGRIVILDRTAREIRVLA
jgi:sugar lactone lactonase YvrE